MRKLYVAKVTLLTIFELQVLFLYERFQCLNLAEKWRILERMIFLQKIDKVVFLPKFFNFSKELYRIFWISTWKDFFKHYLQTFLHEKFHNFSKKKNWVILHENIVISNFTGHIKFFIIFERFCHGIAHIHRHGCNMHIIDKSLFYHDNGNKARVCVKVDV